MASFVEISNKNVSALNVTPTGDAGLAINNNFVTIDALFTIVLGQSALRTRGIWTTATTYIIGDFVLSSGVYYQCILGHTSSGGNTPPNGTYWTVLSAGYLPLSGGTITGNLNLNGGASLGSGTSFDVNGNQIIDSANGPIYQFGSLYYTNGKIFTDSSGNLYYGRAAGGGGHLLADSAGNMYYSDGATKLFDSSFNLAAAGQLSVGPITYPCIKAAGFNVTTDAVTPQNLITIPTTTGSVFWLTVRSVGKVSTDSSANVVTLNNYQIQNVGGTVTLADIGAGIVRRNTLFTSLISCVVSSTNVIVQAIGDASTSVRWAATAEYQAI